MDTNGEPAGFGSVVNPTPKEEGNTMQTRIKWEGKWNQIKGKAKEEWGNLTDQDILQIDGRREQLVGKIQERYGKELEDAEREVQAWEHRLGLR